MSPGKLLPEHGPAVSEPHSLFLPECLFIASAWKPSGISGTLASSPALQIGQGTPAPPQPQARSPNHGLSVWSRRPHGSRRNADCRWRSSKHALWPFIAGDAWKLTKTAPPLGAALGSLEPSLSHRAGFSAFQRPVPSLSGLGRTFPVESASNVSSMLFSN